MKKLLVLTLALFVVFSMTAFAQDTTGQAPAKTEKAAKAPLKSLTGTIGQDGKTFTNDADQKSWDIVNPDAVKGHEGHHVTVKAHVYADKNQIHVMSVKMAGEKGAKKKGKTEPSSKM